MQFYVRWCQLVRAGDTSRRRSNYGKRIAMFCRPAIMRTYPHFVQTAVV